MLEGQSCLISRALPSSCEQESKWVYMTYRLIEVSNGKRRFEEEEEGGEELMGERKSSKRIDLHEKEEMIQQPNNLSLSLLSNRSDQKGGFDLEEAQINCELPSEEEEEEDEEDVKLLGEGELSMQMDTNVRDEMTHTLNDLSLSLAVTSDLQDHSVDQIEINCMDFLVDEEDEVLQEGRSSANPEDYGYQAEANYELPVEHKREAVLLWKGESSKLTKPMDMDDIDINTDLSLWGAGQSSQRGHDGDQSDMESLIQSLGRDISIDCLLRCSRSDYNSIAQLSRSFRDLIRYGELYRLRRQKSVIEHWVYFSCHSLEWEAFDPISRRWMHLPRLPSNECFMWSDKESLAVGTELLVFGREFSSLVIWRYSILTNSWSSGMQMNAPRCLFGSASFGEIAILAGGCDLGGIASNTAELYNSETGTWEILPSMNKPRKMCSGVFMDGKFYVIGGKTSDKNTDLLSCGEEYNLETRTWREIPNMFPRRNEPSEAPPLVAVVNNELYAADYADNVLRKYDKERVLWVTVGRLPARAASMNGWGLAFRACGEHLIVIGGPRATGGGIIELNSWIPREGPPQWNLLASKHSASFVYNCAVMGC